MRNVLKIGMLAAGAALAFFGVLSPASATLVQVTYTGTVFGLDITGVFGPPLTTLNGNYTAVYIFDTALGVTNVSPAQNFAYGGTCCLYPPSPSLGAVLTINGGSFAVGGSYYGGIFGSNDGTVSTAQHDARDSDDLYILHEVFNYAGAIPASITSAYTYTVGLNDSLFSAFRDDNGILNAFGTLTPSTLTYSVVSDVPEPATLLLLGTGLFGLGLMRRRSAARNHA